MFSSFTPSTKIFPDFLGARHSHTKQQVGEIPRIPQNHPIVIGVGNWSSLPFINGIIHEIGTYQVGILTTY